MPLSAPPAHATPPIEDAALEAAVDQIIADCDGNQRAAIRALVVATGFLERELDRVRAEVSHGFVRGRYDNLAHAEQLASGHSGER